MAVYYNLKGTTQDQFQIGKGGPTIHKGTATPTGIDGDFWLDTDGELKVRVGGSWELIHFDNLAFAGNSITSTDIDGNISIVPDGVGDVVLGAAAGGTSTMTAPDDQDVIIQAGPGTGANDGGDLTLRGGSPEGAGAEGDVILGTAGGGTSTMTAPDDAIVVIQAGPATVGNPGADIFIRGGDGTAGTGIDGDVKIDVGNLILSNSLSLDSVVIAAVQTSAEGFADNDTSIMTSAAIDDRIISYSYSTTVGTVTSVTAGTGMTQTGGTSPDPVLNVIGATNGGILVNADSIQLDINALAVSTIATGDFLAFEDITGGLDKKITHANLEASFTILESQITDSTILARVASDETISGTWTFSNTISGSINGNAAGLSATLVETSGGTGTATYATGDILYASAANTLSKLTVGTNTHVLTLTGGVPVWESPAPSGNSFATQTVTDTDSGYTWAETGSAVADSVTDTLTWVSGTDIDLDVDATADAILVSFNNATGYTTNTGTVTTVSVVTANGLAGSVATSGTTPAITLSTTITGMLKGNGTAISAGTAGTDYSVGTSALATGILKSTTATGALSIAIAADFPTLNQDTTGSAAKWTTARTVTFATGDVTGSFSIDGSAIVSNVALTIADDSVTYAKMQNAVSGDMLLGREGGASGIIQELSASSVQGLLGYVDLTTAQTVAGIKTWSDDAIFSNNQIEHYVDNSSAGGPAYRGYKSLGTLGSKSPVTTTTRLMMMKGFGWDGTSYVLGGEIIFETDGTVSTGIVPTKIEFQTMNAAGTRIERMIIDPEGAVGVGVVPSSWSLANGVIQIGEASISSFDTDNNQFSSNLYYDGTDTRAIAAGRSGRLSFGPTDIILQGSEANTADEIINAKLNNMVSFNCTTANATFYGDVDIGPGGGTGGTSLLEVRHDDITTWATRSVLAAFDYTHYPNELYIGSTEEAGADQWSGIMFAAGEKTAGATVATARISAIRENDTDGDCSLLFWTRGADEIMRLTSDGNVGINNTTPTQGKVDIVQTTNVDTGGITVTNSSLARSLRMWVDGSNNARIDSASGGTQPLLINDGGGDVTMGGDLTVAGTGTFDTSTAGGIGSGLTIGNFGIFPFGAAGSGPTFRPINVDTGCILRVMPNGAASAQFEFFGTDWFTTGGDNHWFKLVSGATAYSLYTTSGGILTDPALSLYAGLANAGQLYLSNDGNVSMTGDLDVDGTVSSPNHTVTSASVDKAEMVWNATEGSLDFNFL